MSGKKVAVAMSVYRADTYKNLKLSIESMLTQTYQEIDIYIQVDGEVSEDCYELLRHYSSLNNIFVQFNEVNKGLATRLNEIIKQITDLGGYSFIARMDADDISYPQRIEEQVNFFENNPGVSVLGTDLIEISDSGTELFHKKMAYTHSEILKSIIKRCPVNHPTVMFRESVFSGSQIRYKSELMNTQDYYLWVDLLEVGYQFANIDKPLLYFRINADFHSRRGWNKAKNEFLSRVYALKKLQVLSFSNIFHIMFLFLLRISPPSIKLLAYKYLR